jgi:Txe/YoeB family toxin of Txe-Axe toxin-antitoxin module
VNSKTTRRFWKLLENLPPDVQAQARAAFLLFQQNPFHASLNFKHLTDFSEPIYSARINAQYRALGKLERGEITWFWVGSHADYDKMISKR